MMMSWCPVLRGLQSMKIIKVTAVVVVSPCFKPSHAPGFVILSINNASCKLCTAGPTHIPAICFQEESWYYWYHDPLQSWGLNCQNAGCTSLYWIGFISKYRVGIKIMEFQNFWKCNQFNNHDMRMIASVSPLSFILTKSCMECELRNLLYSFSSIIQPLLIKWLSWLFLIDVDLQIFTEKGRERSL